jgi:NAD(P)-dependent dehydrogenase (short-subunit alcohol dehydrogenase family)
MKNILLIGGSYGIGLAIAKELVGANKFTSLQEQLKV